MIDFKALCQDKSWLALLEDEFKQNYLKKIGERLSQGFAAGERIFPPLPLLFEALNLTPFDKVKVIIIGQDPYHGEGQSHGLSFSVPIGTKIPPSLRNIYKEIEAEFEDSADLPFIPQHGNLTSWASQGVLLLNRTLSVKAGLAGSHQSMGWEQFTDKILQILNSKKQGLVFMLWGKMAQAQASNIDGNRHLVLKAAHPSPLSAYHGFLGCGHFKQANEYLIRLGKTPIDWRKL